MEEIFTIKRLPGKDLNYSKLVVNFFKNIFLKFQKICYKIDI